MLEALLFDVDGTLAETEELHRAAFNATFRAAGLDWAWDPALYRRLLQVAGGRERIRHYVVTHRPERALRSDLDALVARLHADKTRRFAEIVRSGIQSVDREQIEAAKSIGLGKVDIYRKVILPQALRVILPPAAAQYVSLSKNSSLGTLIGYPELFNINNQIVTLSGHTIEAIGIMMAVYLTISFTISTAMNLYNRAIQIKER